MKKNYVYISFIILNILFMGALFGQTHVIKTKYFEIMYSPSSAETAALIAEYADGYAEEISQLLETSIPKKIPVYIYQGNSVLNAYFSPYPYNKIVVYDALPYDGQLGVFTDTILMVFYHELTHAISLNIRTPFWQLVSSVVGDAVSINSAITMPPSFIEGVTVSFESRNGEGRLNDPVVKHLLIQDKLEGKFLSWKEAAGALDVFPGARSYYIYGGYFSSFLQKKYGMAKYAEFWRRGGGFNPFLSYTQTRFQQVYGLSLEKEWENFEDSITVPNSITENFQTAFKPSEGVFTEILSSQNGLFFADQNIGKVGFVDTNGILTYLFDCDMTLNRLSVSPDGNLLAVSRARTTQDITEDIVQIFDINKKSFTSEVYVGYRDASFYSSSDVLIAIKPRSQRSSLVLLNRSVHADIAVYEAGPGKQYGLLFNPVFGGDGQIFVIAVNGMSRFVLTVDVFTGLAQKLELPEAIAHIRYLRSYTTQGKISLIFSWASDETLYRYAVYDVDKKELFAQIRDFSGGVFSPALDFNNKKIFYSAHKSGKNVVLYLDFLTSSSLSNEEFIASLKTKRKINVNELPNLPSFSRVPLPYPENVSVPSIYNPIPWLFNGFFMPMPFLMPKNVSKATANVIPGFVYATGDPTERFSLMVTPAFSADPYFVDYELQTSFATKKFGVSLALSDHLKEPFDTKPYRVNSWSAALSHATSFDVAWRRCIFQLGTINRYFAPKIDEYKNLYSAPFSASSVSGFGTINFVSIKKKTIPSFPLFAIQSSGYQAKVNASYGILLPDSIQTAYVQTQVSFLLPFAPLSVSGSYVVSRNILFGPLSTRAKYGSLADFESDIERYIPIFPEYSKSPFNVKGGTIAAGLVSELALLSYEIQKGLPIFPLYANRFMIHAGYRGLAYSLDSKSNAYVDSVYGKVTMQGTIVMGVLNRVLLSFDIQYAYPLRSSNNEKGLFIPNIKVLIEY